MPDLGGAVGWLNTAPLTGESLRGKVVLVDFWTYTCERERANVQRAVRGLHIDHPVAIDSDYRIWEAFGNQYWPALYFIDAKGRSRTGEHSRAQRIGHKATNHQRVTTKVTLSLLPRIGGSALAPTTRMADTDPGKLPRPPRRS